MSASSSAIALRERFGLALLLMALGLFLAQMNWLWRWDQLIYDAQLRFWSRPAAEDIVIIAVDESSLAANGRWPWRRELHAQLLDRLTEERPRAVGLDIIFAEPVPDNPTGDQLLQQAIARNGRVVLPVMMALSHPGGPAQEILPLPALAEVAGSLGHVDVELDPDGIARSVYLQAGLGNAYWPHFSRALLALGEGEPFPQVKAQEHRSPMIWVREQPMLIPYAGPPGHFRQISYQQVLQGEFLPGSFTAKYVLVGSTATGLGDVLPTPVSGYSYPMSGVEVLANVLDALRQGISLTPIAHAGYLVITALLAFLPMLLFPLLAPRAALVTAALLLLGCFVLSGLLLWLGHLWFPPAAAMITILLGYPLWSWRRLELAMGFLNQELDELTRQREHLAIGRKPALRPSLQFLSSMLPLGGWVLFDQQGKRVDGEGQQAALPLEPLSTQYWMQNGDSYWKSVVDKDSIQHLGVVWLDDEVPTVNEELLLHALGRQPGQQASVSAGSLEVLQARIAQVQDATRQLQEMRSFVDDSLSNMSDGVVVTDALGQVLLANGRASWYLQGDDHANLTGMSLLTLLQDLAIRDGAEWHTLLQIALLQHSRVQATARHSNGRDVLVQIAPLKADEQHMDGLILNFSDISPLKASERKRDELLNFLSHDLRSPLVSLLALFELTRRKQSLPEVWDALGRMKVYTEKTLNLAEQFLQLARAESGEDTPFYDVDLINLLDTASEQVWAQAQAKEIAIAQSTELAEAWVLGDGNLLERALINLLTNAIKYSPGSQTVHLHLQRDGEFYRICVEDQGMGIAEEEMPRLFDRFQRVHRSSASRESGAGLGLAFVDAVIKRHGGQVEVKSVLDKGSCFCLLLKAC